MSFSKSPHQPFSLRAQLQSALVLFGIGVGCLVAGHSHTNVAAQEKEAVAADTVTLPVLPASVLPLEFVKGEKVAFLGNSQAERMNLFGNFETYLHLQFPDRGLVVRNFGRPAEEVDAQQRSADYTAIDDPLKEFNADTYLCFFGFKESFSGVESVGKFKEQYKN